MCEPTTLAVASFAVSAGSAVASHISQQKASKAAEKSAMQNLRLQHHDLAIRQQEEMQAVSREIQAGRRRGAEARSAAKASAAEAGVGGISVDLLLGGIERDEAEYVQSLEDNAVITLDQLQRMKLGASAGAANRIAANPQPSVFGTGLTIGGAGLDLATRLKVRKPAVS